VYHSPCITPVPKGFLFGLLRVTGGIIRFEESGLRALPERIVVKLPRELMPITCLPKPGARDAYFEFVRQDANNGELADDQLYQELC
jgi:hypothetical protein